MTGIRSAVRDPPSLGLFWAPSSAFLRFSAQPPRFTPHALAATSTAVIHSKIARRSSSARIARMPTVTR